MEFNATFVVSVISFVLFTLVMNKIFYKPVSSVIEQRKSYIKDIYDDAEKSKIRAQEIIKSRDEKIFDVINKSKRAIFERTQKAKEMAENRVKTAKLEVDNLIADKKESLQKDVESLENSLSSDVEKLAEEIVKKVIGK